ncbi:hypothetical protein ABPG74_011308 [Tetrahymena malaccensis]
MRLNPSGFTLIGVDYGTKFLGLSITDTKLKKAYMLETIETNGDINTYNNPIVISKLKKHISKENVKGLVIGATNFKRFFDSEINIMINKVDTSIPFTTVDESYTTYASKQILEEIAFNYNENKNLNLKQHKDLKDGISSMLILQIFLDYYNK